MYEAIIIYDRFLSIASLRIQASFTFILVFVVVFVVVVLNISQHIVCDVDDRRLCVLYFIN